MKMIGYLPLGYPTLEQSLKMADIYLENGCDAVEIGIPSPNPCYEKETIRTWMQQAYAREPDYEVYFEAVKQIRQRYPDNEIYTMVYEEVLSQVTPGRYAKFCREAHVDCVISANLTPESVRVLDENGVDRCSFGSFILDPKRLALCLRPGGLIYMQTKPFPGQNALPGYETLDKVIGYMRDLGITRPIYCGGGIQSPEDARRVKAAGADGFFVGTAIVSLADSPDRLQREIAAYKRAIAD